jgi:MFS transporter, DHA1 family, multidrug resistance protein
MFNGVWHRVAGVEHSLLIMRTHQILMKRPGSIKIRLPLWVHCAPTFFCPASRYSLMSSRLPLSWLLILGALTAFAPMAIDMYLPALPNIATELNAGPAHVQLTLAACFLGFAFGQLLYGPLADRFGRKPPLYLGVSVFVLASIGCALATSIEALIALRFLQALGGCAGVVITRAMVRDRFAANEVARLFSLLILVMGLAPILAPLLGGWLLQWVGWRAIFVALALFGLACGIGAWRVLEETLPHDNRQSLHPRALAQGFVSVLRERQFYGHVLAGGFAQAGMFAYITSSAFVFIEHFQVPAAHFGWIFGANAAGLIGLSQLNRRLLKQYNTTQMLRFGNTLALTFALLLLATACWSAAPLWAVAAPLFGFVASLGITLPNASANALAPFGNRAGTASALLGTIQFLFAALAAVLVSALPGTLLPSTGPLTMASVIAGCASLAWVSNRLLLRTPHH